MARHHAGSFFFYRKGIRLHSSGAFIQGLFTSMDIIAQMALLVLTGFLLVRKNWLSSGTLTDLTGFLIDVVIPCAFILAMARSFTLELLKTAALLPLISGCWIALTWLLGTLFFKFFPGDSPGRDRSVTGMMMISNSLYLPLPVILAVTPPDVHDQAIVFISVISLPSIIFMWTVGVKLLGNTAELPAKLRLKRVLNPPILSFFAGILLSFIPGFREAASGQQGAFPPLKTLFSAMNWLSMLLSPLAMLILGGMIASGRSTNRGKSSTTGVRLRYLVPLITGRLLLIPGVVYLLIRYGDLELSPLSATILLLVAAAPPATNHALIARKYDGEWEMVASLQLAVHAVAVITLPLWLTIGLSFTQ